MYPCTQVVCIPVFTHSQRILLKKSKYSPSCRHHFMSQITVLHAATFTCKYSQFVATSDSLTLETPSRFIHLQVESC